MPTDSHARPGRDTEPTVSPRRLELGPSALPVERGRARGRMERLSVSAMVARVDRAAAAAADPGRAAAARQQQELQQRRQQQQQWHQQRQQRQPRAAAMSGSRAGRAGGAGNGGPWRFCRWLGALGLLGLLAIVAVAAAMQVNVSVCPTFCLSVCLSVSAVWPLIRSCWCDRGTGTRLFRSARPLFSLSMQKSVLTATAAAVRPFVCVSCTWVYTLL